MTQYVVLCAQVITGSGQPFEVVYGFDGERFPDRKLAIRHGFTIRESDDFNIGVLKRGKLVSLDWMLKPIETDPSELRQIAQQIGVR